MTFRSEQNKENSRWAGLGKAKATSPAVVSQGAVLRGCSAPPVAGAQHSEAADRGGSALLAAPFWESAGHSPALLKMPTQK